MTGKTIVILLFILMYIAMILKPKYRAFIALGTAFIFVVAGFLPLKELPSAVDWNVLMMIAGTMILVDFFIRSKMPNRIADRLLNIAPNMMWATILMAIFAGIVSAFIDNVATVLMMAPVGLAMCRKLKINPVPMILCIAVSSNLQGAATLVGDATSIMLGSYAKMDFMDFFWMHGRPGIFFAVEIGALLTVPIMMFLFRKDREPVEKGSLTEVNDHLPFVMLILFVVTLIFASFFKGKPSWTNGVVCLAYGVVTMILDAMRKNHTEGVRQAIKNVDYMTLLQLASLFVVIAGVSYAGVIEDIARAFASIGSKGTVWLYIVIVWGSVLISAFIDNIPYVATMLPVIASLTSAMGVDPYLMYFGLLTGATLGGNLTPIGASANITATGILRKEGYEPTFGDFARIGIPFTVTAVLAGSAFIWFFWHA